MRALASLGKAECRKIHGRRLHTACSPTTLCRLNAKLATWLFFPVRLITCLFLITPTCRATLFSSIWLMGPELAFVGPTQIGSSTPPARTFSISLLSRIAHHSQCCMTKKIDLKITTLYKINIMHNKYYEKHFFSFRFSFFVFSLHHCYLII